MPWIYYWHHSTVGLCMSYISTLDGQNSSWCLVRCMPNAKWRRMGALDVMSVAPLYIITRVRFKYRGGDNAHWISKNKMAATAIQWELCGTNFRANIASLWVSCFNGNNNRSARVLFVQHPREQGEWLRWKPRYARVLTASFALLPRVLDEQHLRSPVIIP